MEILGSPDIQEDNRYIKLIMPNVTASQTGGQYREHPSLDD
jgi:hypothetical protein